MFIFDRDNPLMKKDIEEYDLFIITPHYFKKTLQSLSKHKNEYGIKTKVINLGDIYNSEAIKGRDRQEKIKYFIKKSIERHKIKYVLLVGSYKQLPVRYIHSLDRYRYREAKVKEPPFISDLYYADIYNKDGSFSTWDSNKNNIFGEWTGKKAEDKDIDLRPDVCIGRLPCKNKIEVKIIVNKIINYEKKTFGKPWFKNIVAAGGNTHPELEECYEGEATLSEALGYMKSFNHTKLFASYGNLNRKNIIKAINKGCGFLSLEGHGNPPFWITHKDDKLKWCCRFSNHHMKYLLNGSKLPICIASGCRNSAFDTTPINIIKHPHKSFYWMDCIRNCWMWAITRKASGGAIASIGSTSLAHLKWAPETEGKADAWSFISPRFYYEYNVKKVDILGEIWKKIIHSYLKKFPINWETPSISYYDTFDKPTPDAINARTVQQCILFGDPTLKIGGYKP